MFKNDMLWNVAQITEYLLKISTYLLRYNNQKLQIGLKIYLRHSEPHGHDRLARVNSLFMTQLSDKTHSTAQSRGS